MAVGESRFLFQLAVREGLDEIWKKWAVFHALKVTMKHSIDTKGHYGEGDPEKEGEALKWFFARFTSLPDMFDELKLGGLLPQA